MKSLQLASVLLVALAAQAAASGIVTVRSNARADVFLDGNHMGRTPLTIRSIAAGNHKMTLVDPSTDHSQIYAFHVTRRVDIAKEIDATFRPNDPPRLIVQSGYNASTNERGYRYESDDYRYRNTRVDPNEHIHTSRDKVRIRNTALGVGALGAIVGSGPLTILGFGGAAVNEIANH